MNVRIRPMTIRRLMRCMPDKMTMFTQDEAILFSPHCCLDIGVHYKLIDLLNEPGRLEKGKVRPTHERRGIGTDTDRI